MYNLDEIFGHYDATGLNLVKRAYAIASEALKDDIRYNGHPFIEHPMNVARIVEDEIGLGPSCVAAVLLHEAMERHDVELPKDIPAEVRNMVEGLNRIATIKPKDTRLEAENYKKLIVQYSTDPRVTVLKIADRLEVMRSLDIFPRTSRDQKQLETLMLYIPLAHQLGLYNIKSEMENIYFRYAEPEQYRVITNKLKATERDRQRLMEEFIEPLKKTLSAEGIGYKLKMRTKTAYSIYRKMQKQKVPFEGVFDVFAIRFVIDCDGDRKAEQDLCWKVYSFVTQEYEPDTKRLRDWVSQPKANGYESLHITVRNKAGAYVEVQIRTARMDDIAENGHASHWSYKGIKREETLDRWLSSVRYNLEHPQQMNPEDLPEPPSKEIFVFTPTGELRILPAGSSILDFAFNIHSGLGLRCTGGKVNGKAVPIKEKLKTGDVVEIMSGKNQKPSSDWVNFVVSTKARNKIRQALREAEYKKAAEGKELLGRRLKNWKLSLPDEYIAEIMKKRHLASVNAFYAAVGDGDIDVNDVKNFIQEHALREAEAAEIAKQEAAEKAAAGGEAGPWENLENKGNDDILVLNAKDLKGIQYNMAKCCNPVFGDDVFGFVTRTEGIKIHRMACPNASRLLTLYPYRIQKVKWAATPSTGSFQATLRVTAALEPYIINQIMDIIHTFKASLRSFNVSENQRAGTYEITMKVSVPSASELDKVISQTRALRSVLRVTRT